MRFCAVTYLAYSSRGQLLPGPDRQDGTAEVVRESKRYQDRGLTVDSVIEQDAHIDRVTLVGLAVQTLECNCSSHGRGAAADVDLEMLGQANKLKVTYPVAVHVLCGKRLLLLVNA